MYVCIQSVTVKAVSQSWAHGTVRSSDRRRCGGREVAAQAAGPMSVGTMLCDEAGGEGVVVTT
jgi:hypothetical protein